MCGIVGYSLNEKSDLSTSAINKSLALISHRGPDDKGEYFTNDYKYGLGHVRLSIIDTSLNGHQPMISKCKKVTLVYNGEIYNFKELREELEKNNKNLKFASFSDTEVLLQMYLNSERNFNSIKEILKKLNGIFAFAIFDKSNNNLFVVRDAMGVKPLYYLNDNGTYFFASEIKGIPKEIIFDKQNYNSKFKDNLDLFAVKNYLKYLYCPGEGTPLKNVRKVGPGEIHLIRNGSIIEKSNWAELPAYRPCKNIHNKKYYINKTTEILRDSVHRQLISDVPVGAFLSGGLDSSSIVAFAKEKNPNISCFTIKTSSFDGFSDDYYYARKVSEFLNIPLEVIEPDESSLVTDFEKMIIQLDEPIADPAPLNVFYISQLAKSKGIKVLLSGTGGDDLFSGYRRHQAINFEKFFDKVPNSVIEKIRLINHLLPESNSFKRRVNKFLNGFNLQGDERLANYFIFNNSNLEALFSRDFKSLINTKRNNHNLLSFLEQLPHDYPKLEKLLALEKRFFLADHNLIYTDKLSMKASIEVRVPFLDKELVEFAATIPAKYKLYRGKTKWILKKAMEEYLPKEIIYRPKTGFGLPVRRWIKNELKEWVSEMLSEQRIKARGVFDPSSISTLIRENNEEKMDASYLLLSLIGFEIWCSHYID